MPPYRPSNSLCTRVSVFDGCWNMGFFQAQHLSYWRKVGEWEKKKGVDLSLSLKWISLWMVELFITLCHHIWLLKKIQFPDTNYPSAKPLPFARDHLRLNYLLKENMSVFPSLKRSTCLSRALFHHPAGRPSISDRASLSLYWFGATVSNTRSHKDTLVTEVSVGTRESVAIKLVHVCGVLNDWFIN